MIIEVKNEDIKKVIFGFKKIEKGQIYVPSLWTNKDLDIFLQKNTIENLYVPFLFSINQENPEEDFNLFEIRNESSENHIYSENPDWQFSLFEIS